ncbi:MAG: uracil-DNA glycosylase [Chloroflexota bacterium]
MEVKDLSLAEIHSSILVCPDCPLSQSRTKAVPGEGHEKARIMFIGEAPGWHEDQSGRPFVGQAGHFLDELLDMVHIKREEVFITNIIKCRPPGNRDPLPNEVEACYKYLKRQIELIQPQVIVTLGRHSMAHFLPRESIGKIHGTWRWVDSHLCFAMYHPAAALHQQSLRRVIQEDILKLPQALAAAQKAVPEPEQPKQLSFL